MLGALSPSRAGDFLQCPLLYRFRTIDRLPERPGLAAFRGTLVHEVLDRLFDLEPQARDLAAATALTEPALADLLAAEPEAAFALEEDAAWPGPVPEVSEDSRTAVLAQARALLEAYFVMEDPTQVVPEQREQLVEVVLEDEFVLRGYVDRLDSTAAGLRVVDYKTGRSPGPMWEQSAMFQLRFYALIVHRATGRLPHRLQLLYLGNGEVLTYHPDAEDLAVAIGCDPGHDKIDGLRYGKVVILADADSDGLHIATLLSALFLRHFPALVRAGHVFVAMPPLFRIDAGKQVAYALDEAERDQILEKFARESRAKPQVMRFKGLGEMNPSQLRETTMDPRTRRLVQLTLDARDETDSLMDMLLAKKRASDRREWLEQKGNLAEVVP